MKTCLLAALLFVNAALAAETESNESEAFILEAGWEAHLASIKSVSISVTDQVVDGCLPSPEIVKNKLEIGLRKNNFRIKDNTDKGSLHDINIHAIGFAVGGDKSLCVVNLTVSLNIHRAVTAYYAWNVSDGQTFTPIAYTLTSGLMSGPKNGMQKRIESQAAAQADTLYLEVSRAQDKIFSRWPSIKENYEANVQSQ